MVKNVFFVCVLAFVSLGSALLNEVSAETATIREKKQTQAKTEVSQDYRLALNSRGELSEEKLHPTANKSYNIGGITYQPGQNVTAFAQEGNASWYGKPFHGRKTASGERFDMYELTAAHRTLPIPSYVKVTNLKNGKEVVVKINDRGPFHGKRVLDLSFGAAKELDFLKSGTAKVKIERVFPAQNEPVKELLVAQTKKPVYVTLKTFDQFTQAQTFLKQVSRVGKDAVDERLQIVKNHNQYSVRLGPFAEPVEAQRTKQSLLIDL